jgi:hypothetical protein
MSVGRMGRERFQERQLALLEPGYGSRRERRASLRDAEQRILEFLRRTRRDEV